MREKYRTGRGMEEWSGLNKTGQDRTGPTLESDSDVTVDFKFYLILVY